MPTEASAQAPYPLSMATDSPPASGAPTPLCPQPHSASRSLMDTDDLETAVRAAGAEEPGPCVLVPE